MAGKGSKLTLCVMVSIVVITGSFDQWSSAVYEIVKDYKLGTEIFLDPERICKRGIFRRHFFHI